MLTDFNRSSELTDSMESNYLKLLYYDLPPMSCDYKSYEYSRLCTIIEGFEYASINKDTGFAYKPGQFILLPPYSNIHIDVYIPTKALVLELNNALFKKVLGKISIDMDTDYNSLKEYRFFLGSINDEIGDCLDKLLKVYVKNDKNNKFLLDLYAQELAYNLVQIKGVQQVINFEYNNPIHKSILYIQNNITKPISISQLAQDQNMSESKFSSLFKKMMGITPKEYITNFKMSLAKDMLSNQNVTEVAVNLGYDNISYFIALFKYKYGITPKQYKSIGQVPVVYHFDSFAGSESVIANEQNESAPENDGPIPPDTGR